MIDVEHYDFQFGTALEITKILFAPSCILLNLNCGLLLSSWCTILSQGKYQSFYVPWAVICQNCKYIFPSHSNTSFVLCNQAKHENCIDRTCMEILLIICRVVVRRDPSKKLMDMPCVIVLSVVFFDVLWVSLKSHVWFPYYSNWTYIM